MCVCASANANPIRIYKQTEKPKHMRHILLHVRIRSRRRRLLEDVRLYRCQCITHE